MRKNALSIIKRHGIRANRGGPACLHTELRSISGAALGWNSGAELSTAAGVRRLATQRTTDAVGNSCSPLMLPV